MVSPSTHTKCFMFGGQVPKVPAVSSERASGELVAHPEMETSEITVTRPVSGAYAAEFDNRPAV